jgi:hypothetical protein
MRHKAGGDADGAVGPENKAGAATAARTAAPAMSLTRIFRAATPISPRPTGGAFPSEF